MPPECHATPSTHRRVSAIPIVPSTPHSTSSRANTPSGPIPSAPRGVTACATGYADPTTNEAVPAIG